MALGSGDLVLFESSLSPAPDDTVSTVGGSITPNTVDSIVDEVFGTITANEEGGAAKVRYGKVFYKNTNAGSPLYGAGSDTGPRIFFNTAEPAGHTWRIGSENTAEDTTTQGTAPTGVTFIEQDGSENFAVILGSALDPGSSIGVWIELTLDAGTDPNDCVEGTFRISGVAGSPSP